MNSRVKEMHNFIAQRQQEDAFNRRVRQLATTMAGLMYIRPEGIELIELIGTGEERNNLEALQYWIKQELHGVKLADIEPLDYLYARIQERLGLME